MLTRQKKSPREGACIRWVKVFRYVETLKVNNHAFIGRCTKESKIFIDSVFIFNVAFSCLFGCLVGKLILIAVINRAIPCRIIFPIIDFSV